MFFFYLHHREPTWPAVIYCESSIIAAVVTLNDIKIFVGALALPVSDVHGGVLVYDSKFCLSLLVSASTVCLAQAGY